MKLPGKGYPWKKFFVDLKNEYSKDNVSDAAGALTFFGVLALFPFLLFLVALASMFIDPQKANALVDQMKNVAPKDVTNIIGAQLQSLGRNQNVGLLTVGALGAIWSASSGISAVMRVLNTAYDVKETRPFWKTRGIAILFTIGGGALGIIAALAMVALPGIASHFGGFVVTLVNWLRFPAAAVVVMFVWAVAYYLLPDAEQRFKFITPGSVFGVIVWLIASWGFSEYVSNFGKYDATYGSLGGVIVLLLWMWISAQVLIIGAEVNALIEHASPEGKDVGEKTMRGAEVRTNGAVKSKHGRELGAEGKAQAAAKERAASEHARAESVGLPKPEAGAGELQQPRPAVVISPPIERPRQSAGKKFLLAVWGALVGAMVIEARRKRPA